MTVQLGQTCFASALEAHNALAASHVGKFVQVGTATYSVSVVSVSDTAITFKYTDTYKPPSASATNYTSVMTVGYLPPCVSLDLADGVAIGWLIGGVWLSVFAVMYLRKAIQAQS